MKTKNNKLVALIEMHASANENGQDELCNALYHAINELAKTIGYKGENACDELSANGELEIDGVCYQFDGKTILPVNTIKTYRIETMKTRETIMNDTLKSLAEARARLVSQYEDAYENNNVELCEALLEARYVFEEKIDAIQSYSIKGALA
jgi:hypothetical protein